MQNFGFAPAVLAHRRRTRRGILYSMHFDTDATRGCSGAPAVVVHSDATRRACVLVIPVIPHAFLTGFPQIRHSDGSRDLGAIGATTVWGNHQTRVGFHQKNDSRKRYSTLTFPRNCSDRSQHFPSPGFPCEHLLNPEIIRQHRLKLERKVRDLRANACYGYFIPSDYTLSMRRMPQTSSAVQHAPRPTCSVPEANDSLGPTACSIRVF